MAVERERNRVRSRVDELPPAMRALLDKRLADTSYSYQDIADELQEEGYQISRSSIGRYAMKTNATAKRLKEAREQSAFLIQSIRDQQNIESGEVASAILIDMLTQRIVTAEDDVDQMPIDKAGRLLVQLQRSNVYKERYQKERRATIATVEQRITARLRDTIQNNPALLDELTQIVRQVAQEEAQRDES